MKRFDQWYLPDCEEHLQKWMSTINRRRDGRLTYQSQKYDNAIKSTTSRRVAIDVGSHIGLWAFMMARDFARVVCFEPMPEHVECWQHNMEHAQNAQLIVGALGEKDGLVSLRTYTDDSSGDTRISGVGDIPMRTIDSYNFDEVDFIKIDCEGYEVFVLRGARETLLRCKPVIIVEQKRDMSEQFGVPKLAAVDYLLELGYVKVGEDSGDYIMTWGG